MNPKVLLALLLVLVLPSVSAVNGILLTPPTQTFFLEEQTSLNAVFGIQNNSNQTICWNADATTNSNDLLVSVASQSLCLNAGEQTELTVTLTAPDNATTGAFDVNLMVVHSLGTDSNTIRAQIEQQAPVLLSVDLDSEYCNTKNIHATVTVQNNSNAMQSIALDAKVFGLVGSLEDFNITLLANQSRELELFIPLNLDTPEGEFELDLFAITGSQHSVQKFSFDVTACDFELQTTAGFELNAPSSCSFVAPGQTRFLNVNVENTGNTPISITVSVGSSPFVTEIDEDERHVLLKDEDESESVGIEFNVPLGAEQKTYHIPVHASSLFATQTDFLCLTVAEPFTFSVFPINVSTNAGNSFGLALTIQNTWGTSQTVNLSNTPTTPNATVSFSQSSVSLSGFQQKTVLVTVQTAPSISLGTHALYLKASNSNATVTKQAFFTVLAPGVIVSPTGPTQPVSQNILELYSFAREVRLSAGESKELAFVVHNSGDVRFDNIEIVLQNAPNGLLFVSPTRFGLDANQTVTVRGRLIADSVLSFSGIVNGQWIVRNTQTQTIENVQLELAGVQSEESHAENPIERIIVGFTGLVGFAGSNPGIGLIVLIALVLWLLFGKNRLWTLFLVLLLVIAWFALDGNWLWFGLVVLTVVIVAFAVHWSRNRAQFGARPWRTLSQ